MTVDALRQYGANVEEGLARCLNNEAFYLRLVGMSLNDSGFGELETALAASDWKAGFEAAHKLKGVLSNLALTPILEPVSSLTEKLRACQPCEFEAELAAIRAERDSLRSL